MKFLSRVVWSEGMHLAPHHFQTQSRYFEDSLWFLSANLRRNPWGLLNLSLDTEAIRNGKAIVQYASGIFPDGLVFDFPESDQQPPVVNLAALFAPADTHIILSLAIRLRHDYGLDCDLSGDPSARYSPVERSLRDETICQDEYPVAFGRKNIELCSTAQLTPDQAAFPIARILRDGRGGFVSDPEFIPPCLRIGANEYLLLLLKRLVESIDEKVKTVGRGRRTGVGQFEVGTSALEVSNHWFLHALCSALPSLRQHLAAKCSHPEELYVDLARLSGALCTFSLESNTGDIPKYSHLELSSVFAALDRHIRQHLEIVVPSNTVALEFRKTDHYIYTALVIDERCLRRARWIMGIRSDLGESNLLRRVPQIVKVCSAEGVAKLVQRALPGLELLHLSVPPSAIFPQADMHYFSISTAGPCWQHLLDTRQVGVYIPGEVGNASFEVTVITEASK
jgi:type VI secretion system protein ImpJ